MAKRTRLLFGLVLSVVLVAATGCGTQARPAATPAPSSTSVASPPGTTVSQSLSWQQEGTKLLAVQGVEAAYESLPIDVTAPGPATLYFGPLPAAFPPAGEYGISFAYPPDMSFSTAATGGGSNETVLRGTQRYLAIHFNFQPSKAPGAPPVQYEGLRIWIDIQP